MFTIKETKQEITLDKFNARKQTEDETTKEFGKALIHMANKLNCFKKEEQEKILIEKFSEGLFNTTLKIKAITKREKNKNKYAEEIKLDELMKYIEAHELGYAKGNANAIDSSPSTCSTLTIQVNSTPATRQSPQPSPNAQPTYQNQHNTMAQPQTYQYQNWQNTNGNYSYQPNQNHHQYQSHSQPNNQNNGRYRRNSRSPPKQYNNRNNYQNNSYQHNSYQNNSYQNNRRSQSQNNSYNNTKTQHTQSNNNTNQNTSHNANQNSSQASHQTPQQSQSQNQINHTAANITNQAQAQPQHNQQQKVHNQTSNNQTASNIPNQPAQQAQQNTNNYANAMQTMFNHMNATPQSQAQNTNTTSNNTNCARSVKLNKLEKKSSVIKGKAIFNNTLVEFMLDTGADVTIINEKLFEKIKKEAPNTTLKEYKGHKIVSCA